MTALPIAPRRVFLILGLLLACGASALRLPAAEPAALPKAWIDGMGPGWVELGPQDFVKVNCDDDTWSFQDGAIRCTGEPTGVIRTAKKYTNFELVVEWQHQRAGGNSGVFLWLVDDSLVDLPPNKLPQGIEVQVLDLAFADQYEARTGKRGDWFTAHGDVFAVGKAKMTPFPPLSPNGSRSFPRQELSRPAGQWNHYYIRAINGEVRLWVNGEEVSGGSGCDPCTGYLALESEGSPIEFRNLRIRELP